jgi:hypothetical protein
MTKYFQTGSGRGATTAGTTPSALAGKRLQELLEIARKSANQAREERKKAEGARDSARKAMTKDAAQALADAAKQHFDEADTQAALAEAAARQAKTKADAVTGKQEEKDLALSTAAAARAAATAAAQDKQHAKEASDAAQQIADTA